MQGVGYDEVFDEEILGLNHMLENLATQSNQAFPLQKTKQKQ